VSTNLSESEKKRYVRFQKYPFRARRGARRDQRTLKPRGAAASVNSTRGALRDGRGATKRSSKSRRQRRVCVSLSRGVRLPARDHDARASCPRRRVERRFGSRRNETEPGAVGKANRGADVSIAAHLLPPRSAPARRGARSAEAVVRASADMLAGNGGGEPRARSCASVWSRISRTKRFPLDARIESARAFSVARSLGSHKLPRSGICWRFGAQRLSASFRHTPRAEREGNTD
jgi:hypothetical protein